MSDDHFPVRSYLRAADDWLWSWVFGDPDYMGLHPPLWLRLKILTRLPLRWVSPVSCDRPIFIVGCPRSGTTLLFSILKASPALSSLGQESHWVWEFLHPPEARENHSQVLRAEDLTCRSERFIRSCYGAAFGQRRFVDKCPTNSLRIGAIKRVFPDAQIVCLLRNGPDNVSSLIDTWTDPDRFLGFDVPKELDISGYGRQTWVHFLPPGWQAYAERPIEEVCAHQWLTVNGELREAKEGVEDKNWMDVYYEDLLQAPSETTERLLESLRLPFDEAVVDYVDSLDENVVNTTSQPGVGKWRRRNPERVKQILPMIESTMERLGYQETDAL